MRKIIAITQVTLDGVMQAPGGPEEDRSNGFTHGGWAMPFMEGGEAVDELIAGEFDLLLGRRTYDIFASYWPRQDNAIARALNQATKYVVTRGAPAFSWARSQRIGGVEELRLLKLSSGPPLQVWGSGELLQTLMAAGLLDEHRLWVVPIVLGEGKRLFREGLPPRRLILTASQRTPKGVLLNTYRPA